jgi:hypothetical protein
MVASVVERMTPYHGIAAYQKETRHHPGVTNGPSNEVPFQCCSDATGNNLRTKHLPNRATVQAKVVIEAKVVIQDYPCARPPARESPSGLAYCALGNEDDGWKTFQRRSCLSKILDHFAAEDTAKVAQERHQNRSPIASMLKSTTNSWTRQVQPFGGPVGRYVDVHGVHNRTAAAHVPYHWQRQPS